MRLEHAMYNPIYGGRNVLWELDHDVVGQFIERHGLQPLPRFRVRTATLAEAEFVPRDLAGGDRIAHLHHDGQVFPMERDQWGEFARERLDAFAKQLAHAEAVTFEAVLDLGEAVADLPLPIPRHR